MSPERENIAIAELAIYLPAITLALYVSRRHGFIKKVAWLYIVIFCGLRIAGAIVTILSVKHPTSITDAIWGAILGSIGLSPLLLAALGLLNRLNELLVGRKMVILVIGLLHILAILGLILAIVGGTRLASSYALRYISGQTLEEAGGILFLVVYLALVGLAAGTMVVIRNLPSGESRILFAVLAALSFLAVRLLYSLLSDFRNDSTFSVYDGNATVQLCMAIIEEMIVMALFLAAGVTVPPYKRVQRGSEQIALTSSRRSMLLVL